MQLGQAVLYDFELMNRRVRLWKRLGESYEHVLMKALGYTMFVAEYPQLEIERDVGLRYKPDLVARAENEGGYLFWGECGSTTPRKTAWLLKHAGARLLVLFKIGNESSIKQLADDLRARIDPRYRTPSGRLRIITFISSIIGLTLERRINSVPESWYTVMHV